MKKVFLIFAIGLASLAWKQRDSVDRIQTPAQAFIAEIVLRTGAKVESVTVSKPRGTVFYIGKPITFVDVGFKTGGQFVSCQLKIRDNDNFYLLDDDGPRRRR